MNLLALTDFNLVATHGGFGLASRISGRPKATLSRHVQKLEDDLGLRLLERSGRSFRLTEEGQALHVRTRGLIGEIDQVAIDVTVGKDMPRGKLRVSCPLTFGHGQFGRLAAEFVQTFPDIQIEVTTENRAVDLIEEGYDAVIRVNPGPDTELVGRCFSRDQLVLVASPAITMPTDVMSGDASGAVPAIVGSDAPDVGSWTVMTQTGKQQINWKAALRLPSPLMMKDAALAGAGAAILGSQLVAHDLADARLHCWGSIPDRSVELWVLHTSRRLKSSKVAAFVEFLCHDFDISQW
jgi:DNA-binding transcriptional LysR family regulator